MAATGWYFSRYDRALRADAKSAADGRLMAEAAVDVADIADPGNVRTASPAFHVMGPGDVKALAPGAILRRHPSPGSGDAEETKLALVEFAAADLPWRYTPQLPSGQRLRPWLVLVVGVPGAGGVAKRPDGTVRLSTSVQAAHDLADSWDWAHVHRVPGFERSRLVSPAELEPDTGYVAALVPTFTATGAYSWTSAAPAIVACYDAWEFRTGPQGDFPSLARQLRKADLADLALRGGRPFGRADLAYRVRGTDVVVTLPAAGALRVPAKVSPDPADAPPPPLVTADVAALRTPLVVPDGRDVITAPDYPGAFLPLGTDTGAGTGWAAQLTGDPRVRGAAGLGAWTAIAWQDRIAEAAAVVLGDTAIAAGMIRALALGVAASRSMWRRRVPADPVRALALLAPSLGRLPTDSGHPTALAALAARHSAGGSGPVQLAPALFSSAARRAVRPGAARSSLAAPGAADLSKLIDAASRCPDPAESRDVLARVRPERDRDDEAAVRDAVYDATDDAELAETAIAALLERRPVDPARLAAVLAALRPGRDGETDRDAVQRALDTRDHPPLPEHGEGREPDPHAPGCSEIGMRGFGSAVAAAIDPTVAEPPAARRVFAMLPGIRSMRPLEVEPELDIPLWSFLSSASPDWMLPGVGDLREHEVIGVETNPLFVQALLVGANRQAAAELRWRNIPLVPRSSPLRRFWQRAAGAPPTGSLDDAFDIRPVRHWPAAARLGDATLVPAGRASEAVVVFKSPIFRRYPTTVVYLYDARPTAGAAPDWDSPPGPGVALAKPKRVDPTFTGTIGPTVTFFGFPVPAAALADHWVVLEEPPAGYRFAAAPSPSVAAAEDHSGDFAHRRFALPVRVLLGPLA